MKTCLPHYSAQLDQAATKVSSYLASDSKRPLNNLILGPPGAGKSFVAGELIRRVQEQPHFKQQSEFVEANFADVADYAGVQVMLQDICKIRKRNAIPFVLVDEFDVSLQGSSLIRFLINPMFGGTFTAGGGASQKLDKCVFIFCGSHLRSRTILNEVSGGSAEVDIVGLYFDLMLHYRKEGDNTRYRQKREMLDSLSQAQPLAARSSNQSAVHYLLHLEKLQDFLSRINGFVMEIPDLAAPLEICAGIRFDLTGKSFSGSNVRWSRLTLSRVDDFQNIFDFWRAEARAKPCAPYLPITSYKTAVVKERLARVRGWLGGTKLTRPEWAYLGTIWLKHGMRSLETLVNAIKQEKDNAGPLAADRIVELPRDTFRAHIVEDYGGPVKLYYQLCAVNCSPSSTVEIDQIIGV